MFLLKKETTRYLVLLLVVIAPLFSLGLSNHGLWSADEPRVAEIGREMALTGNWVVPRLNEKPFLEHPPLYYASLALTFKVLGVVSDRVARVPTALFAFGSALVLFLIANFLFGPRVALLSVFIMATTGEYFRVAHWIVVDNALVFFVTSALGSFLAGYLSEHPKQRLVYYTLFYIFCTLAFLTKGFIGIVIPGLSILSFLIMNKNLRELVRMHLWFGVAVFFAMTLPWFVGLWHEGGAEYFKVFFLHNHLQRFLPAGTGETVSGTVSGHHHPFYYYLSQFPVAFLPWSILLVPALYLAFSRMGEKQDRLAKGRLFAKCWFLSGIIFLSLASTKRALYLLPLFPAVAMLVALYIDAVIEGTTESRFLNAMGSICMWIFSVVLLLIGAALAPAYLYLKTAYALGASPVFGFAVVLVSVLATGIAVSGMVSLQRRRLRAYWITIGSSIILILVFTLTSVFPLLDRHKSFVPFSKQVAATVPRNVPVYAYRPDETLRGALPFYTGRFLTETGARELKDLLARTEDTVYVVIRDRKKELEKELLASVNFYVVVRQDMGTDRSLVLLSNRMPTGVAEIGDPFRKE